ncbi:2-phospho-L-lactate guanylyltransferase [Chloroflexi bacterium TSY]|nr:2-phospho-L-lactate guanylyltransferase [Chloroflexi bacterium TSY]
MKLWILIPVKPFSQSKSRLAQVLNPNERAEISRKLLEHVLTVAKSSLLHTEIVVISRGESVLAFADALGALPLREQPFQDDIIFEKKAGPHDPLNHALSQARDYAMEHGADAILVLPADLPFISLEALNTLIKQGSGSAKNKSSIVIAPSKDNGTNALFLSPPDVIDFAFGKDSFHSHRVKAVNSGILCVVHQSLDFSFDLDLPADLADLYSVRHRSQSLEELGDSKELSLHR